MGVIAKLIDKAKKNPQKIVLPEARDSRILQAAHKITQQGIAEIILLGDTDKIQEQAGIEKIDLDEIRVIDPIVDSNRDQYIDQLLKIRNHKGLTPDQAENEINNPLVLANILISLGKCAGCVAGADNTTSDVVRTALQIIGAQPGTDLVSSFFLMEHSLPHQAIQGTVIYADCAMVIDPDASQLAEIAIASTSSAKALIGLDPKVALLSFSTAGSAKHAYADKVIEAGKIIAERAPELPLMTEVQFDAAISQDILDQKAPDIHVNAPANVFIFPDLQSANIGYKIAQRIGGVSAVGPILQGLNKPVNDLSRGCSVEDIVQLVAITSVQSNQ